MIFLLCTAVVTVLQLENRHQLFVGEEHQRRRVFFTDKTGMNYSLVKNTNEGEQASFAGEEHQRRRS
jgi:hypothetical protein